MAPMVGEERGAGFEAKGQEPAAQDGEGLSGFWVFEPWRVFAPLRVALPVVLILDAPMTFRGQVSTYDLSGRMTFRGQVSTRDIWEREYPH